MDGCCYTRGVRHVKNCHHIKYISNIIPQLHITWLLGPHSKAYNIILMFKMALFFGTLVV